MEQNTDNYPSHRKELGLKELDPKKQLATMKKIVAGDLTGTEVVWSGYDDE